MSILHRSSSAPVGPATIAAGKSLATQGPGTPVGSLPGTWTGAAWFGICTAVVTLVVLIVFMAQSALAIALALLFVGVGVAVLAVVMAGARIRMRRLSRQRHWMSRASGTSGRW